jgi:hypothetical protein
MAPRFLHVANGTSVTGTLAAAGVPGARSIWSDPLYEGPVPAVTDDQLVEVRSRYLSGEYPANVDPVNDLRQWRAVIAAHDAYDESVLWFEHDLFDQLNLIQLLDWMRPRVQQPRAVSLICINSFPGHSSFRGLGELVPGELASLLPSRRPVRAAEYDLASRAWSAFLQPSPESLDDLRRSDTETLPFLGAALERFLQEYPWTGDGLSRSERRLLQLAAQGPIALRAAFPRMHDGEHAYYLTDLSLASIALTLSRTDPPLLEADGVLADSLSGAVCVTDDGREVLEGRRDRVSCGLDRWLGGVHVTTGGDVWRWDDRGEDGRSRMVRTRTASR